MVKNTAERKHSMLTRQATQSRTIQKTKRAPTQVTKAKQTLYKKQRTTLPSSRFTDENNENFRANGLDYESLEYADYYCGDEYTSSQSKI